jgi:hypothetical protein
MNLQESYGMWPEVPEKDISEMSEDLSFEFGIDPETGVISRDSNETMIAAGVPRTMIVMLQDRYEGKNE